MAKSFLNMQGYPRGLRNNNPGNIRASDPWQGMIGTDPAGFAVFKDISWGIRAMAKDLTSKINNGYDTLQEIIYRWAPPTENDTEAYLDYMIGSTLFARNQQLTATAATVKKIIRGIIDVELGYQYASLINSADIDEGYALMNSGTVTPGAAATAFGFSGVLFLGSLAYAVNLGMKSKKLRRKIKAG